ncbi:MAG: hypothetical protein WA152_01320 [Microgenomates group bacterium]
MLIANILGVTLFFFLLWKRLKDDYHYEKIFNLSFCILFGVIIGYFVSKQFPIYWFWIQITSIVITFGLCLIRQKMKFFESLDSTVIGLLPWLSFTFLIDAIDKSSLSSFLIFWVGLIFIFLFFFLDSQYRKFAWYKSGRVGFAGVLTAGLFFLSRVILYLIYPQTISFIPNYEIYLSGTFAFVFFLLLYRLSVSSD